MLGKIDPLALSLLSQTSLGATESLNTLQQPQKEEASFTEAFAAGFDREALVELSPITDFIEKRQFEFDDNYNPIDDIEGTQYEKFSDEFATSPNKKFTEVLKIKIDDQLKRAEDASGVGGFLGSLTGSIINPSTFLPFSGIVKGSRAAKAFKGGLASAGAVGISEGAGLLTDVTRTKEEALLAIAMGGTVGGLLFGLSAKLGSRVGVDKKTQETLVDGLTGKKQTIEEALATPEAKFTFSEGNKEFSELAKTNPLFSGTLSATKKLSPELRIMTSKSNKARDLMLDLSQSNLRTKGEIEGVSTRAPGSTEALLKVRQERSTQEQWSLNSLFKETKKTTNMKKSEFFTELTKAVRRGGKHENPVIANAAKSQGKGMWTDYLNKLKEAQAKGDLGDDLNLPSTAKGYLPMYIDRNKLLNNIPQFKQDITLAIKKKNPDVADADIKIMAQEVVDNQLASNPSTLTKGFKEGVYKATSTQKRTLPIDASDIEDFLENDYNIILNKYVREVETELTFKERYGSVDMKDQLKAIDDDYLKQIGDAKTPKEAKKLSNEQKQTRTDMEAMRDIIQGKYGISSNPYSFGSQVFRAAKNLNFLRLLGMGSISQIPDMAKNIGIVRLENLGKRFSKGLNRIPENIIKLDKRDQILISVGMDSFTNTRAVQNFDLQESFTTGTRLDKLGDKATGLFSVGNLMSPMNDVSRKLAAEHITQNMIDDMQLLVKGSLSKSRKLNLLKAGVNEKEAEGFIKLFNKHKVTKDGATFANVAEWGRDGENFLAILKNEVDNVITVPTAGNKSLWMRNEFGSVLSQFRGFTMGAYHKTLLPGLQDLYGTGGENAVIYATKVMSAMTLGALTYTVKEAIKGRDVDLDPKKLIIEGMDRGGALPLIMDASNILDNYGVGIGSALGTSKVSRFRESNITQLLGGPSGQLGDLTVSLIGKGLKGEWSKNDRRNAAKLVPGYNLLYWNFITDKIGK